MKKPKRLRGPCFMEDCKRRGGQKIECEVCLKLADAGKIEPEEVFSRQFCDGHKPFAWTDMQHHVLSKHKGTAFLTALKLGYEDPVV
jgi:hypothetical protein